MNYEEIYRHFIEIGMFGMIEEGIISGHLADEKEGVYYVKELIRYFEGVEEYEKCHKLHTLLTAYIKIMELKDLEL